MDAILNRYGISTEYTGMAHLNVNIVVQSKYSLEQNRKIVRDKQGFEAYNLITNIQTAIGEKINELEQNMNIQTGGLMQTTNHGLINRYGA